MFEPEVVEFSWKHSERVQSVTSSSFSKNPDELFWGGSWLVWPLRFVIAAFILAQWFGIICEHFFFDVQYLFWTISRNAWFPSIKLKKASFLLIQLELKDSIETCGNVLVAIQPTRCYLKSAHETSLSKSLECWINWLILQK